MKAHKRRAFDIVMDTLKSIAKKLDKEQPLQAEQIPLNVLQITVRNIDPDEGIEENNLTLLLEYDIPTTKPITH